MKDAYPILVIALGLSLSAVWTALLAFGLYEVLAHAF